MAENRDDEQSAADFNPPSASFLKRADELTAVANQFIAEERPWMAEMYLLQAEMHRNTAASVAAQEQAV